MHVRRTLARLGATAGAAGLLTLGLAAPASAHVTVTPSDTAAGAFVVLTFSVPHGCEGSPTTGITIQVPEEILSVTADPQPAVRGGEVRGPARRAGRGRPRQQHHRAGRRGDLHRLGPRCPTASATRSSSPCSCPTPRARRCAFPVIQTCEKGETAWVGDAGRGAGPRGARAARTERHDHRGDRRRARCRGDRLDRGARGGRAPTTPTPTTATGSRSPAWWSVRSA